MSAVQTPSAAKQAPLKIRKKRYGEDQVSLRRMSTRVVIGVLVATVFLVPYAVMLVGSLKTRSEILSVPPMYFPVDTLNWSNYATMWDTPETPLPYNLATTVIIAVCSTLLVLLVATPAAYYTARFKFPGKLAFLFLVIVTQMLQPAVLTAGLFREMLVLGINDTWLAMILINAAFNLSFALWIMHSFFANIPKEVDEAAQIDGAGKLTVLLRINLPLVWPGIVTAVIFTFVSAWNEFAAALVIMTTAENQPLSVALTKFIGQYATSWQYVFGVSIVSIIPVVILFALIEKRLIGGLTAGAVK
ncbi:carbohydrate ABC transporter permease [Zhihengliuella halotolerans]|uniref:Multiple sugar transport system permease protein n=1 Tax=Zhihengliuella halotolerans TaxID=370736 RepID=A0A4Q8AG40_9MICC|nr:carbohydrate ABC transporter permease [Zhihengliuella halotolerans]RZU62811.1 multiple sugar transport system permease protein [Zhihengliuella halotolerans]